MLKVVHDENETNDETVVAGGRSLLDEIVRDGARAMLAAALQAEVAAYVEAFASKTREGDWWWTPTDYGRLLPLPTLWFLTASKYGGSDRRERQRHPTHPLVRARLSAPHWSPRQQVDPPVHWVAGTVHG